MGQCQQRKRKHELTFCLYGLISVREHFMWRPGWRSSSPVRGQEERPLHGWECTGLFQEQKVVWLQQSNRGRNHGRCGHWEVTEGHKMQSTVVRVSESSFFALVLSSTVYVKRRSLFIEIWRGFSHLVTLPPVDKEFFPVFLSRVVCL